VVKLKKNCGILTLIELIQIPWESDRSVFGGIDIPPVSGGKT